MANSKKSNIDHAVQQHYQNYPYPLRDPDQEKSRLFVLAGSSLSELNHWLFRGEENFNHSFRVLIAGGGTGDATTFLALQLLGKQAEVVYLDFSSASLEIAKQRAESRGLKNIRWVVGDLLQLPHLNLGKFDYIDCSGVLHHLASPLAGLKILKDSLTDKGGMGLMVYAKYGRTGVYVMQELLRRINEGVVDCSEELVNGRKVLESLPKNHWFLRSPEPLLADLDSEAGFYDLCLHKRDRAYSIPEMYQLVKDAGLHFVSFQDPLDRILLQPERYIQDEGLLGQLKRLNEPKRQAIAEILSGNFFKHSFYVSKKKTSAATLDQLYNVPYFYAQPEFLIRIQEAIYQTVPGENSCIYVVIGNDSIKDYKIKIPVSIYTKYIFKYMDENHSLQEMFEEIRKELQSPVSYDVLQEEVKKVLEPFVAPGILLLRSKSVEPFKKWM
ncbi:MAG: class I SAM-dependent methyltransferase [Methylococcales bacterium]|nr:class I SAM-dependent methyltransferase [Methylococcales bacterium]